MAITEFFAGIAATDYEALRDWYERLLGRPPDFLPHDTEAVWQIAESGWLYVVADPDRAGSALITILVDDLDTQVSELAARGLTAGSPEAVAGAVRKAEIVDPEGNKVTFAEVPPES
ncbi:MAG: hypothetical protein QOJ07_1692 [Thermoleophilaceae bacterium]|jgi:catechol 2,3-dioxygenase-like lactoylglutathione lyase family enzyme|nr:hypothetical protein [Thermoleophilaceae bacterium]